MRLKNIIFIICALLSLTGCSTTEKFSVYGSGGTKIYTPYNTVTSQSIASQSDKVDIAVPSDMYCGFILAQPSGCNVKIPIGLDYKISRHTGTKAALYAGGTVASVGIGVTMIGTIAMIAAKCNGDDEESDRFGLITGIGAAAAGVGACIGAPSQSRLRQTAYDYNFGYEKQQRVEIPRLSFTLLNPNKPKGYMEQTQAGNESSSRRKASSGKDVKSDSKSNNISVSSSKVNKNRSDYSKKIEGTYIGTGSLLTGTNVDENYTDVNVIIKRIDRNHVSVNVIESGEEYFEAPLLYEVVANKNNGFNLVMDKLPDAVIRISKDGKLHFNHKKVNIDNVIYTLDIKAKKR